MEEVTQFEIGTEETQTITIAVGRLMSFMAHVENLIEGVESPAYDYTDDIATLRADLDELDAFIDFMTSDL